MRIFFVLITYVLFANASYAGEQEDVSKCISSAKRYADVTLGQNNYTYDGGWLSSDVTWYGNTPALCELGSKVTKLVINGQTYIVDGFAGVKARSIYSMKEAELDSIRSRSEALTEKYNEFLIRMKNQLKSPKPDLDKITDDFDTQVNNIKLRILGTTAQLEAAFSSDEVIKNLSEDGQLGVDYKAELAKLTAQVANLKDELSAYKTPVAPIIEEILSEISDEKFDAAYAKTLTLRELPLYDLRTNKILIDAAAAVVQPIPSSEYDRNLNAYKFLLKLAPENSIYLEKVNSYEQKISDANEEKKVDDVTALISSSDDLVKYRAKMAKAVLELIQIGKCSREQVEYYGGWVKSGERKGEYFMDCGSQRVWFNPKAKTEVYADRPITESRASEMCKDTIRKQSLNSPTFHLFDTSYTVHHPRKAITYVQGFDVKNAYGTKMKYRAYCLIQPSGNLELSLVNR